MKKLTIFLLNLLVLSLPATFGQKPVIELTFSAEYYNEYVPLDSIYIENLTQGGDTILYAPDTVLVLDYTVGVTTNPSSHAGFRVLQNRPNPFNDETFLSIFLPEAERLNVSVINLMGQKIAFYENSLEAGTHSFVFYPGSEKYYILSATANGMTKAIKMVCLNNHSGKSCSLIYQGQVEIPDGYKSIQETNNFGYSLGDQLLFIGYAKNPTDIIGSDVIEATPTANEDYVFEIIEGIPCPGTPTVTYEGQTYATVQIGNQCWFKENLNIGTMLTGSQNPSNNGVKEKYCYNDIPSNCSTYGGLYQWDEMMQYSTQQGTQGICPLGWHIPTDTEWTALTDFLGGQSIAGGKMKETGNFHWNPPNMGATNESGFTALPGGLRNYDGGFYSLDQCAYFWSSTEDYTYGAWLRFLYYFLAGINSYSEYKTSNFSSRCLNDESASTIPTVTTAEVNDITPTTATSGGEVTDDGGAEVTARGVCWNTSQNPTIADSHTSDGTGVGIFVSSLTGLIPNTPYFVRAYATNSAGTAYGNEVTFTTLPAGFNCGDVVNYEGQNYNTVLIGNQCWLKENLNVGAMINGSQNQTNNSVIEKYCYDNNTSNCTTYGGLYQWDEMMQYTTQQGTQGICPSGWHIPTDAEWCALTQSIDQTVNCNTIGGSGTDAGTKMKSTTGWLTGNGTNTSGFTALPGGYRSDNGTFYVKGILTLFWSSTEFSPIISWIWFLNAAPIVNHGGDNKVFGYSVRCLNDEISSTFPTVTTAGVINISQTAATCEGEVTDGGGGAVSARGVCWSTSQNPTTNDPHTNDGIGIGTFFSIITGLTPNTPYYVRAYATNNTGTAYGDEESFTTSSTGFACGDVVNYEGQNYNTVLIGTQCWFRENLNIGTMINGSQNQTNNSIIEKYCYNNNASYCTTYGGLYQWDEMMQYTNQQGTQGICPAGWHIPADAEWTMLTDFLGGLSVAGGKMKETGTLHWLPPNTGATNESGFTALPGGERNFEGYFYSLCSAAYLWSSTETPTYAWRRELWSDLGNVGVFYNDKTYGCSARCMRY